MIVLDASLIIAHVLGEDTLVERADLIETLQHGRIVVPAHWPAEIGNALTTNIRRNRISQAEATAILHDVAVYNVDIRPASRQDIVGLVAFAAAHKLTAYDAAYVMLAVETGAVLATLDKAMRRTAIHLGIDHLPA